MARSYLLDTNVISILAQPSSPLHVKMQSRFEALGQAHVFLPVMAVAELEFGMRKARSADVKQQAQLRQFFRDYPLHLPFDQESVEPYALMRAQLWRDYGTPKRGGRGHKEKLPEDLFERSTGKSLGIDERDLLIATIAIQYRLILLTNDSNEGMRRISEAATRLETAGDPIELRIEYWP